MRIAFHIALILSILYMPWWTAAIILVCACFMLDRFYEAILYGIAVDALFGTEYGFHGLMYAGSIFSLVALLVASLIRDRLAW
jgi:hypothetical protein